MNYRIVDGERVVTDRIHTAGCAATMARKLSAETRKTHVAQANLLGFWENLTEDNIAVCLENEQIDADIESGKLAPDGDEWIVLDWPDMPQDGDEVDEYEAYLFNAAREAYGHMEKEFPMGEFAPER